MTENYELKIISQDEISKGKTLKQYDINDEKVIGVYENETFLIQFKNKTWNKVQVKISLDGSDVLTCKLADTSNVGEMWVCNPYETLELKCWPETNKGGAEFVFGKTEDSVAVNTHGVKTGIGYIAAAVFVEEVVNYGTWFNRGFGQISFPKTKNTWTSLPFNVVTYDQSNVGQNQITVNSSASMNIFSSNAININSQCAINNSEVTLSSASPAIGAGEYVAQEITKVAGLNKPKLTETIVIKYEWWVSLRSKIRASKTVPTNPAFPGDQQATKMIDLKSTPRKKKNKISKEAKYPELNRFG